MNFFCVLLGACRRTLLNALKALQNTRCVGFKFYE